jgi:glyoxylase-like metal-dependent hydrolase (beta-lactamase superfamily II)
LTFRSFSSTLLAVSSLSRNHRPSNVLLDYGGKPGRATPLWRTANTVAEAAKAASRVVFAAAVQNARVPGARSSGSKRGICFPRTPTPNGLAVVCAALWLVSPCFAEVNKVETVAPDVYFHEGDLTGRGHCNTGWVILEDYVLVIDANFPSGAQEVIPKIKALTNKPIRFAFDTHHHGDHAYGNQVWVEQGATPVAHTGVIEEMKKYETGLYGDKPGRWEDTAKDRPDVAASKLKPPTLLFRKDLIFDDGKHRVELLHFGVAHTHGDGFAWLPKERILFTGDACVNGPYNYVGDGDTSEWIKTLEAVRTLHPKTICPGHGPQGGPEMLEDQINYFKALRGEVKKLVDAGKKPDEVKAAVDSLKETLSKEPRIGRYVGSMFAGQVEKVYVEMGGKPFQSAKARRQQREEHSHHHGSMAQVRRTR